MFCSDFSPRSDVGKFCRHPEEAISCGVIRWESREKCRRKKGWSVKIRRKAFVTLWNPMNITLLNTYIRLLFTSNTVIADCLPTKMLRSISKQKLGTQSIEQFVNSHLNLQYLHVKLSMQLKRNFLLLRTHWYHKLNQNLS